MAAGDIRGTFLGVSKPTIARIAIGDSGLAGDRTVSWLQTFCRALLDAAAGKSAGSCLSNRGRISTTCSEMSQPGIVDMILIVGGHGIVRDARRSLWNAFVAWA